MRPVSPAYIRSLTGAHKVLARATVCTMFQTGTSPIGTQCEIIDGSVTMDSRAAARTSGDVVVSGIRQWPIRQNDRLAPYGNEVYVEAGIEFSDALVEYVGLGYLRIETDEQTILSDNPIRLVLIDRMQAIIEGRLLVPQQFEAGVTYSSIMTSLITEIYPDAVIEWDDSTEFDTVTRSVIVEEDRYGFLNDMVASLGKIWYWDHRGVLVIKALPTPTNPVYEVKHGAHGVLVQMNRVLTRQGAWNAVVASGEGADTNVPVRGVAIDNDPGSPTYFYGRFGQVPRFYSSPFLNTDAQCDGAAQTLLDRQLGIPYTISFGSITNHALEPYDPVLVKFSHYEAPQTHVLDMITLPLTQGGVVDATTREQHIVLAEAL